MLIHELSEKEDSLILQTRRTQGTIEVKIEQLADGGVFEGYKLVHSWYAKLAKSDNEALKRGLFLQWYGLVAAPFLSGINDIDPEAAKHINDVLDEQLYGFKLDAELHAMVSYYVEWEFTFESYNNSGRIQRIQSNRLDYESIIYEIKGRNLIGRGQMGNYWKSIIDANS